MTFQIDASQAEVLREILQSALAQLRLESARADAHDFRAALHARERVVEALLTKLVNPAIRANLA
jgi:hypothetical protein